MLRVFRWTKGMKKISEHDGKCTGRKDLQLIRRCLCLTTLLEKRKYIEKMLSLKVNEATGMNNYEIKQYNILL